MLVGGIGGSGTRVVTEILMSMGFFMGNNLNGANDYMGYGLAEKLRELKLVNEKKSISRINKHIYERLGQIEIDIKNGMQDPHLYNGWGWKVPGNFYSLEHVNECFTNVKYVHVIRHGLDMAFSANQNQLHNWGFYFDIDVNELPLPNASLRYWIEANKFAINLGLKLLQDRFYLLCYDNLVMEPRRTIDALSVFLGIECTDIEKLVGLVHKPKSMGKHKEKDINIFSDADMKEVTDFGFRI